MLQTETTEGFVTGNRNSGDSMRPISKNSSFLLPYYRITGNGAFSETANESKGAAWTELKSLSRDLLGKFKVTYSGT
jgi:hypothetical protein